MKRAAIYARVSRADQKLALQLDECRSLVRHRKWKLVQTYTDKISGAKDRRPGLARMLEDAHRGRFDVLVVWKGDRLWRSLAHSVRTVSDFGSWGIDIVSITEQFDTTTATGRFMRDLCAIFAQWERDIIAERSAAGVAAARRRGARIGRPRVYVDTTKARKLRQSGVTLLEVAKKLKVPRTTLSRALRKGKAA